MLPASGIYVSSMPMSVKDPNSLNWTSKNVLSAESENNGVHTDERFGISEDNYNPKSKALRLLSNWDCQIFKPADS